MIIGARIWELHLPGCSSLKEKRQVVKSLKDRLHNQYNLSVAETAHQELSQRAELAACVVSTERRHADSVLTSADRLVEDDWRARIIDTTTIFY
jgi:uncharacterized protein